MGSPRIVLAAACLLAAACDNAPPPDMPDGDITFDASVQQMPGTVTYVEDFDDTMDVDAPGTTATIDTATGAVRLAARYALDGDVGDGSGGVYAPGADAVLAAGVHQLASLTLDGVKVTSPGDLTLRVDGPFTLRNGARLEVDGALRIVASGELAVRCSIVYARGAIAIHHPTDAAIDLDCPLPSAVGIEEATVAVSPTHFGAMPDGKRPLDVWTRGPIAMRSQGYFSGEDGPVSLRAYGDVLMDGDAYLLSSAGQAIHVETEGKFTMDHDSYVVSDGPDPATGEGVVLRTGAGVTLDHDSYLIADAGGRVDAIIEGEARLSRGSYFIADHGEAPSMRVAARGIHLDTDSWLIVGGSSSASGGGLLRVDSLGPVSLAGASSLLGGPASCGPGGDVEVRATGAVSLTARSTIEGGDSSPRVPCIAGPGGDVLVSSNETITVSAGAGMESRVVAGDGQPGGTVKQTERAMEQVAVDAGLVARATALSRALEVETTPSFVRRVTLASDGAKAFVAADGQTFVPAEQAVGQELRAGWRWRVDLAARLFDGNGVDRLEIEYGPPRED